MKTVVITGAAGGLGSALAFQFRRRNHALALIDSDENGLQRLAGELGPKAAFSIHCVDISDEKLLKETLGNIVRTHGTPDILINNAAVSISAAFIETPPDAEERLMAVNFRGMVNCTRSVLPAMLARGSGCIVNMASIFASVPFRGKSAYSASKAAAVAFSNALSLELAGSGVSVCIAYPPAMDTGLVRNGLHSDTKKKQQEILFLRRRGVSPEIVAKKIYSGIAKKRPRIYVGISMRLIETCARVFPRWFAFFMQRQKAHDFT